MIVYLSILVAIIGLLMWFLSSNAKICEAGKIMFGVGLLAFLMKGDSLVSLLGK